MKHFFLLVMSFAGFASHLFAAPPLTKIKEGGGLFGYETVSEYNDGISHTLHCQGRGFTRCRPMGLIVLGDNDEIQLSDREVESIESQIGDQIGVGNNSGVISFDERVVISYSYDKSKDKLIYTMYSVPQAIERSII